MLCMFFFSNWNLNLFTWAADRIKWLTHCSAIVLPEKRLMQVSEELFLNVKQHLQTKGALKHNYYYNCCYRLLRCDLITWWSLSFSSQMILSTSLLLSFFTVCTSADVDRCCSWKIKHVINMCQRAGQMCSIDPRVPKELTFTWTRLSASRRKLKSPKRKKGAGGWRASEILQGDRTVRNDSYKCDLDQLAAF